MNYYVIVLPMAKDGKVNRQILEFTDYDSAKAGFHGQCAKYFGNETLKKAWVCIIDELCNRLDNDYWEEEAIEE